ncbi:hypothetical protein CAL7716_034880 [Calothrix sp. PCC 7716]|nr:hypothetical protein CAL7716_034880 [Calothrix sp. PCC 7716]
MSGNKEFKKGYYLCPICSRKTLHDWVCPWDVQMFETLPDNTPIPDDIFVCLNCNKWDIDENDET